MTWTYTSAPGTVPRDRVRFLLGDTDSLDQKISDEEIAYALTVETDPRRAAAFCADALATRYEQTTGVTLPGVTIDWAARAEMLRALARRLRAEAAGVEPGGVTVPLVSPVLEGADPATLAAGRGDVARQPLMVEGDRSSLSALDEEIGLAPGPHWEADPP